MWIFLTDAMFSVVEDKNNRDQLMVRARLQGDLERYFPGEPVHELENADYRFRVFVRRDLVARMLFSAVRDIDYPDFKSRVENDARHKAYYDVWSAMQRAQMVEVNGSSFDYSYSDECWACLGAGCDICSSVEVVGHE